MESNSEANSHSSSDTSDTSEVSIMQYVSSHFVDDSRSDQESDHKAEVHPFMHEPLTASNSDTDPEQDSDSSEDVSPRLLNLDW